MELILLFSCQTFQESREFAINVVIESALELGLAFDLLSLPKKVNAHPLVDASEEGLLFYLVRNSPIFLNALTHDRRPDILLTVFAALRRSIYMAMIAIF